MVNKRNMDDDLANNFKKLVQDKAAEMTLAVPKLTQSITEEIEDIVVELDLKRKEKLHKAVSRLPRGKDVRDDLEDMYRDEFRERYTAMIAFCTEQKKQTDEKLNQMFKDADQAMTKALDKGLAGEDMTSEDDPAPETGEGDVPADPEAEPEDTGPTKDAMLAALGDKVRAEVERKHRRMTEDVKRKMLVVEADIQAAAEAAYEKAKVEQMAWMRRQMADLKRRGSKRYAERIRELAAKKDKRLAAQRAALETEAQEKIALRRKVEQAKVELTIEERVRQLYAEWEKRQ
jgi:hypothetical protein